MDENIAIARARKLLKEAGITEAPVDVEALAMSLGYQVSRQDLPPGEAGNTFERRGKKHIWVNQSDGLRRQRFTILHEIAHDVLKLPSKHGEALPSDELERYKGRPSEEVLCDVFAAECLVPWQLIQPMAEEYEFTLESIATLSRIFQASWACVASRLAQASSAHLAFVVAEEGVVQYSITSRALRDARLWIQKDIALPRRSAAAQAMKADSNETFTAELEGSDWSSSESAQRFACYEEATYYSPAKQTISVLTFEEFVVRPTSSERHQAHGDEDLLEELSGHLPWPKR
ncbi:ImmA/IrrE family metallo-endopeptidase [Pseudomonas aeruginosa]|uniref:ImmA/IrrE family metallo-endopeptidase n=1 Tax=Pseudomonas aeruginosa TaxID=287 RepID=UPI000D00F6DA|nr:ImmA/IrrE family metallo-endopeptidase [Pseudomonas aeruginosa]MCO2936842.1 ImmA/IrrE family metallo-endopeptidase [Pseudomonas aeruginosa]RUB44473.1 ImmA/IrrE family metallo-endopeptidase [Pseudomonas aeruginosa]RUB74043.1 ImmA/IrrE family metallo-endopeptidase [Pseudomonas aeruginosa]HBN8613191.1 ImmA/IrrE family metallo-endopeptidase [Pseudomonas aeruginosa]HBN9752082.1 ImmA/IrrE family metallo-endopeptidase [Pseudomonas aeruginosa]